MHEEGLSEEMIISILQEKSRDNSRTPVQWTSDLNAGFTEGIPWINVASNYKEINVERALQDKDSVFYHYQKLIQLRKQYDLITYGEYELILNNHPRIFAYLRNGDNEKLLVVNNFYGKETSFELPEEIQLEGFTSEILISNYPDSTSHFHHVRLRPYESIVYYLKK